MFRSASPRFRLFALLGLASASGACFNPEMSSPDSGDPIAMDDAGDEDDDSPADDPSQQQDGDDECLPTDDPCESADECCGYEGTTNTGDALCSGFDGDYRCTNVCRSDDECVTGCCIALNGITDYGSCMDCSGVPFGSDTALCMNGVAMMCDCLEGTDGACTEADRASLTELCADTTTSDAQIFVCAGAATSCGEAADCIPDA